MTRKIGFVVIAVAMVATLLTGCLSATKTPEPPKPAAVASKGAIIKISVGLNEKTPMYLGAKKFADIVKAKTNGKYDVQVFANAQLGDDIRATEAVKAGSLEMVVTSPSPLAGINNDFNVLDLPFLFPNEKAADALLDSPLGAKIGSKLETHNLKLLAYFENGFRQITNSAREIKTPADLKGLKIRCTENAIHLATFKALGANPTPMPFSEVFTALQQKTIDGQENPVPTIFLSKFFEVQKYVSLTGHLYGPHILLINKKLWDGLPDADKKIFEAAAVEAKLLNRATNREMNKNYVDELRKAGMTVTVLTPDQLKLFRDAVAPVHTEFEAKIGKDLINEVKAILEKNK